MSSGSMSIKNSEIKELIAELGSKKETQKVEAIKKVIVYMQVGKDASALFFPVMKCLELQNIEIKKLVYLYIIHYSRQRPDDAIMVIAAFVKDATNKSNPLIRALAVRTMGCLRVKNLNSYLIDPLLQALKDTDPYVKKTAVMCVPKVYELTPELIEENKIIEEVQEILNNDTNSVVVANTIISLEELSRLKGKNLVNITTKNLDKI